jgi:hypothetical protein
VERDNISNFWFTAWRLGVPAQLVWCCSTTWALSFVEFPCPFNRVNQRNQASLDEEAFILTPVKLATGKLNVELADLFGSSGYVIISMTYGCLIN